GHVVIVANGRDGYAVRDANGRWQRIGFGTKPAVPLDADPVGRLRPEFIVGLLAGLLAAGVGGLTAAPRRMLVAVSAVGFAVGALVALLSAVSLRGSSDLGVLPLLAVAVVGLLIALAGTIGVLDGAAEAGALPGRRAWLVALIGAATAATWI